MSSQKRQLFYGLSFLLLLVIAFFLYQKGLQGGFLLDDESNLREMLEIGKTGNGVGQDILAFTLQGHAGRLGRPVSLLSFALQFHYIDNATAFKYVNLCIHLLIGTLIFWWLILVGRLLGLSERYALPLALAVTALWLLLPIQVSTVLYVIQRMTELAAFFTMMGLLGYTWGRIMLAQGRLLAGYLAVSFNLGIWGILAVLSKENGVLLLLYVVVLEATLFAGLSKPRYWLAWRWSFLYLPILTLFGYLLWALDPAHIKTFRDFTVSERLLTQPGILLDYLFKIFIPRPQSLSLFHDDYPITHSLLDTPTALASVIILLIVVGSALWLRRRYPLYAFGVLWFFAGHILESSFLPLMLYFEHRNYLPLLGPVLAIVYVLPTAACYLTTRLLRYAALFTVFIWITLVLWTTWTEIHLWSQPVAQAIYWAEQKPNSRYALSHAASVMQQQNRPAEAVAYYRHMTEVYPEDTAPYIFWLGTACDSPHLLPDLNKVETHFQHSHDDFGISNGVYYMVEKYTEGKCQGVPLNKFTNLLEVLLDNPNITFNRNSLYVLLGRVYELQGEYSRALAAVDQALALGISENTDVEILKLLWLARAGYLDEALSYAKHLQAELTPAERLIHGAKLDVITRKITETRGESQ